jgi:Zn-dependent peptidase ImmA (M78 family)
MRIPPLVFINAKDFVASKTFTLAHELAHIWIGDSGLTNLETSFPEINDRAEDFCNVVAAEFLVPSDTFLRAWNPQAQFANEIDRLTHVFKVSSLVIARKALDAKLMTRAEFFRYYENQIAFFAKHRAEQKAKRKEREKAGGPSYYKQKEIQFGSRLSMALVRSAQSGKTLYRDAMKLLYISNTTSFDAFAAKLFREPYTA